MPHSVEFVLLSLCHCKDFCVFIFKPLLKNCKSAIMLRLGEVLRDEAIMISLRVSAENG